MVILFPIPNALSFLTFILSTQIVGFSAMLFDFLEFSMVWTSALDASVVKGRKIFLHLLSKCGFTVLVQSVIAVPIPENELIKYCPHKMGWLLCGLITSDLYWL